MNIFLKQRISILQFTTGIARRIKNKIPDSGIHKTVVGSVITLEGTYQGKPIRVRIYAEPAQDPDLK